MARSCALAVLVLVLGCGRRPIASGGDAGPVPSVDAGSQLRVLFIGNSYTYVNDLPGMLAMIASTSGASPSIATDSVTQGGATLQVQWTNGVAGPRILDGGWTHVVLQGQSQEPLPEYGAQADFFAYGQMFADLALDAGATPVWFVTWARAAGDSSYQPGPGSFQSPGQMQDELTFAYDTLAAEYPTSVLGCAGEAFRQAIATYPSIVLQQSDFSHPTVAGTYLAACTFYVALTGQPVPPQAQVPAGLSAEDAAHLRDVAMIGSKCANAVVRGVVWLNDPNGNVDGLDGGPPFDYGIAGTPITAMFVASNTGEQSVQLDAGQSLAPPFTWTDGAFPGGAGDAGAFPPFCQGTLAPHSQCSLSVDYSGVSSGAGALELGLAGAYTPNAHRALTGQSTSRALLTLASFPGFFSCPGEACGNSGVPLLYFPGAQGVTTSFDVWVTNRGALPATSLSVAALTPPFAWVDGGCSPAGLPVGGACVLNGSFTPAMCGVLYDATVDVGYDDVLGPVAPDALWPLEGDCPDGGIRLPPSP